MKKYLNTTIKKLNSGKYEVSNWMYLVALIFIIIPMLLAGIISKYPINIESDIIVITSYIIFLPIFFIFILPKLIVNKKKKKELSPYFYLIPGIFFIFLLLSNFIKSLIFNLLGINIIINDFLLSIIITFIIIPIIIYLNKKFKKKKIIKI